MNTGSNTTLRFERDDSADRDRPEPSVGDTIASGRYTLVEFIGEGGLGTVFRARDNTAGRDVVVKTLITRYVGRPEREQRLFDEFAYLDRIKDRAHVVAPVEVGRLTEFAGWPFLVMEMVPGRSLFSRFILERPLTPKEIINIAVQIACGVQAIHRANIAHRDVTPQNILLHEEGEQYSVTLIDFSHATDTSGPQLVVGDERRLTRVFEVPGTAQYMPPEQADVASGHGKMDIYSLGVVLYEMVTGRNPFAGLIREEYIELQREDAIRVDPIDPRVFPEAPEALLGLIERCTRRRPEGRPDIGQVVRRLKAIQSEISPGSPQPVEPVSDEQQQAEGEVANVTDIRENPSPSSVEAPPRLRVVPPEPSNGTEANPESQSHGPLAAQSGPADAEDRPREHSKRIIIVLTSLLVMVTTLLLFVFYWNTNGANAVSPTPAVEEKTIEPQIPNDAVDMGRSATEIANENPTKMDVKESPRPAGEDLSTQSPAETSQATRKANPRGKRPRRPRPSKAKSDPSQPAQSQPASAPTTGECERMRSAANAAKAQRRWKHVLKHTKARACWSSAADERLALRVEALMDLSRWAECAQQGAASNHPRVQRWAGRCQARIDILEGEP